MLEVRAPSEQEGTRSRLSRWLKKPGEAVQENEPLIELETDKVTVEVAAPGSGVLAQQLKQEGDELEPGELLGRIAPGTSAQVPGHADGREGSGALPATASAGHPNRSAAAGAVALSVLSSASAHSLSPAVRRLLAEHKLQASDVKGTGEGGRITVEDVLRHAAAPVNEKAPPSGSGRLVPHTPVRLRIAEHMVQSLLRTAPHVTSVFEADMGAVIAHRQRHKEDFEKRGAPLTFTAYFIAAAVEAIRAVPEVNSRWTDTALEVFDNIDIGVATAAEQGLVVPVLRNVQSRDLVAIASGLNDLVTRARENQLTTADMRGGTFTLSNHGVSGSLIATPIVIHQPQSAILGIGKLEKRAVVAADDTIVVRPRCYVTLTIDHRVMDGVQANRFLQTFVSTLESDRSFKST